MTVVNFSERRIDEIFASLDSGRLPGAAVGISIRGTPVYRKGFGLASLELPVALSPAIRMRIGSTSKQFTAFAYLLLCEEGRAGLDDPIGRYLPELNRVALPVTMRQLMGNLSGLRDATDIAQQFSGASGRRVTAADLLALYRDMDDLSAEPGTAFLYNNGGWVILSEIIQRIAGASLEEVMRTRIFEPLGMWDSLVRRWDSEFVSNSASMHALNAAGRFERCEYCGGIDYAGAGAIASTVDDMLRWMAHMDAPWIGTAATWAAMKSPQRLKNGASTGYGLGLITHRYRGVETLAHAGGGNGGNAQMLKVPAAGLDVVVMVNRSDVSAVTLVERILDACLPDLEPISAQSNPSAARGVFRSSEARGVVHLFVTEGQQFASFDGFDMPVAPDDSGVLRAIGPLSTWQKSVAPIGSLEQPAAVRFDDFGTVVELAAQPIASADAGRISGRYRSDATGTEAEIVNTGADTRLRTTGRFGSAEFALIYLAEGVWRANAADPFVKPVSSVLSFDAGGFRFSNILTRDLQFRRVS